MDAREIWLWVLAMAAPIAGVVGFAIQLRQVKQTRLENEKLHLEIEALKQDRAARTGLVRVATMDEVLRFRESDDIRYSRRDNSQTTSNFELTPGLFSGRLARLASVLRGAAAGAIVLAFAVYLCYDLYRLGKWFLGLF